SLPPSVPGLRLKSVLRAAVTAAGARVLDNSEAIDLVVSGERLEVHTQAAARRQRHRARSVVLATGGILGGGIFGSSDGTLTETVANLRVDGPNNRQHRFTRQVIGDADLAVFRWTAAS